jgi:hypothetical protein
MRVTVPAVNPKTGAKIERVVNPFGNISDCRKSSAEVTAAIGRANVAKMQSTPEWKRAHLAEGYARNVVDAIRKLPDANKAEALVSALAQISGTVQRLLGND